MAIPIECALLADWNEKLKPILRLKVLQACYKTIANFRKKNTAALKATLEKVDAEIALIDSCYNLKRVINIFGVQTLLEKLKAFKEEGKSLFWTLSSPISSCFFQQTTISLLLKTKIQNRSICGYALFELILTSYLAGGMVFSETAVLQHYEKNEKLPYKTAIQN